MIARYSILLPLKISIPEGERLTPISEETEIGPITIHPPVQAAQSPASQPSNPSLPLMNLANELFPADPQTATEQILMNGRPSVQVNLLRIDYHRNEFQRDDSSPGEPSLWDPPLG